MNIAIEQGAALFTTISTIPAQHQQQQPIIPIQDQQQQQLL